MKGLIITRQVEQVDSKATGEAMRQRRQKAGLSLRELGERMHLSAAFLSDLELGRRPWTENRAQQYVAALQAK